MPHDITNIIAFMNKKDTSKYDLKDEIFASYGITNGNNFYFQTSQVNKS